MLDTEVIESTDEGVHGSLDVGDGLFGGVDIPGVFRILRYLFGGDGRGGARGVLVVIVAAGGECQGGRQCNGPGW